MEHLGFLACFVNASNKFTSLFSFHPSKHPLGNPQIPLNPLLSRTSNWELDANEVLEIS